MSTCRFAVLSLLLILAACGDDAPPTPASGSGVAQPVTSTVHFLSFSRLQGFGEAVPCLGDEDFSILAAAANLRDGLRDQGDGAWLVCIGDSTVQTALVVRSEASVAAARARSLVMLDAMAEAGVDFYVPSHGDFSLVGERELIAAAHERGLALLLTNVEVPGDEDAVESYAVVDHDGLKLALLGAIAPQSGDPHDHEPEVISIAKPVRRVPAVATSVLTRGEAHMTVVFSSLAGKANQALCDSGDDVHFLIGSSDTGLAADRAVVRHGATMMNMRTGGRELGHTTLRIVDGDFAMRDLSQLFVMPGEIAEQESAVAGWVAEHGTNDIRALAKLVMPGNEEYFLNKYSLLEQNRAWVAENSKYTGSALMHRAAKLTRPPQGDPVVAVLARQAEAMHAAVDALTRQPTPIDADTEIPIPSDCVACHREQHDFWASTGHARGYEMVADIGREYDSSCLICHAAGFGDADGFSDPRLEGPFGGVTCYTCHFASKSHARSARMSVDPLFVHANTQAMLCEQCHTPRQDLVFDMKASLPSVSCPPMRHDDPLLVQTLAEALADIERRERTENSNLRDVYRKGRALVGLGHLDEGIEALQAYARGEESTPQLVVDIANEIEEHGRSAAAQLTLREALQAQPQDPTLNLRHLDLLVHARDPSARDPEQVLRKLPLLIPQDADIDDNVLPFRLIEVDALLAVGRTRDATVLFDALRKVAPSDARILALEKSTFGTR